MKHYFITDTVEVGKARIETIAKDLKLHLVKEGDVEFKKIIDRKNRYLKGVKEWMTYWI